MKYKILVVEDDEVIAKIITSELENWGYEAKRATNFENIMEEFSAFLPQLVLLDLSLPFRSGFHWCGQIRAVSKVPVVFVSSAADNMNLVTALHQGADDFIAKPFDLPVLVAKVQALLRRTYDFGAPSEVLTHKTALLDLGEAALYIEGKKVEITKNEYRILHLLLVNKGKVVSREVIMRRLWDDESFIDDNTLTVNIGRLRKKMEDAGLRGFISTRKGLGYIVEEE